MLFKKNKTDLPARLELEKSAKTPEVDFNAFGGKLSVKGRCMPEDAKGFFMPLMTWLDEYKEAAVEDTHLEINLEYFNTSSAKCMLDLMKKMVEIHKEGSSECSITWYYMEEDEDMLEVGETFEEMIDVPFELQETDE